jgi:hypothetical protein
MTNESRETAPANATDSKTTQMLRYYLELAMNPKVDQDAAVVVNVAAELLRVLDCGANNG